MVFFHERANVSVGDTAVHLFQGLAKHWSERPAAAFNLRFISKPFGPKSSLNTDRCWIFSGSTRGSKSSDKENWQKSHFKVFGDQTQKLSLYRTKTFKFRMVPDTCSIWTICKNKKSSLKSLNRFFRPDLFSFYGVPQCTCIKRFEGMFSIFYSNIFYPCSV